SRRSVRSAKLDCAGWEPNYSAETIEGIRVCSQSGDTMRDPGGRSCDVALDCGPNREHCSRWAESTRITHVAAAIDLARSLEPVPADGGVTSDAGM
ncbi:MAG: hypothetical protein KC417_04455, partial [Myxococcales bacterium]|nr:hypothetical protein [Myxococcales bacterium]